MKKSLLFIIFLISFILSFGQTVPNEVYYERLYHLCKVWGFAKYHHTEIAAGNINWDDELLTCASAAKTALTDEDFNDSLQLMLNNAGEMELSIIPLPNIIDSLNNIDTEWIQNDFFTDTVSKLLDTINVRFRPQDNVYIGQTSYGSLIFDNDDMYHNVANPNEQQRILALFRYWNIINYFYPYKYLIDQNWDTVLVEFIPKFIETDNGIPYHLVNKELVIKLNDSHSEIISTIYNNWDGNHFTPFKVRFIENQTVISKVIPSVTEVNIGDIITEIDGHEILYIRDSLRTYATGSNDVIIERSINYLIEWEASGNFDLTTTNNSGTQTHTLSRSYSYFNILHQGSGAIWKDTIIDGGCNIGIVDMGRLTVDDVDEMFIDLWETNAIILDLRYYPQGQAVGSVLDYIYEYSTYNYANSLIVDVTFPGFLYWEQGYDDFGTSDPYNGTVIILFNEETQSLGEYSCMLFEFVPGSIKIGNTTAGADGNITYVYLPGNITTIFTSLGIYYPDYSQTQRIGIIPDYEVLPTISGIRDGQDVVLNFALNCEFTQVSSDSDTEIVLYPNPSSSIIKYNFSSLSYNNDVLFKIFDITGKEIKIIKKNDAIGEINIDDLSNGIYIINIYINNKIINKKIIKI